MATLPTLTENANGASVITFTNANSGGDEFLNNGTEKVLIQNTSGSSRTVTFAAQNPCNHGVVHNLAVVVANGTTVRVENLSPARFNNGNHMVQITYSSATGVAMAVLAG